MRRGCQVSSIEVHTFLSVSLSLSCIHFKIFVQIEEPIYRSFGAAILHFRPIDFILHLVHQRG